MAFHLSKLIYILPWILAFLLATVVCLPWAQPRRPAWIVVAIVYALLDATIVIEAPHLAGTHWNWMGKAASFALALMLIAALRPHAADIALRWPSGRRQRRWAVLGILGAILFATVLNVAFRNHQLPAVETILYQATMPGLSEEFCWRGIVFLLLSWAYTSIDGNPNLIPAAFITTLVFGLTHGISLDTGLDHFAWLPFAYATLFGAWLAFLRLRVRSLWILVIAHNLANVAGALAGAFP